MGGNVRRNTRCKVSLEYLALDGKTVTTVEFDSLCACGEYVDMHMDIMSMYVVNTCVFLR